MKEWIVETNDLTKKFHNFTAVDQVSFHMKKDKKLRKSA